MLDGRLYWRSDVGCYGLRDGIEWVAMLRPGDQIEVELDGTWQQCHMAVDAGGNWHFAEYPLDEYPNAVPYGLAARTEE